MRLKDNHETAQKFYDKAYHLQIAGHIDRAAYFYRKSIEYHPTSRAHTFLGWIYSLKGLLEDAITECHLAIDLDPGFGNPYNDIGAYLIQLSKYNEAIPWLQRALKATNYENYCYPNMNLGHIYERKGNWVKAFKFYEAALKENSKYKPAITAYDRLTGKIN